MKSASSTTFALPSEKYNTTKLYIGQSRVQRYHPRRQRASQAVVRGVASVYGLVLEFPARFAQIGSLGRRKRKKEVQGHLHRQHVCDTRHPSSSDLMGKIRVAEDREELQIADRLIGGTQYGEVRADWGFGKTKEEKDSRKTPLSPARVGYVTPLRSGCDRYEVNLTQFDSFVHALSFGFVATIILNLIVDSYGHYLFQVECVEVFLPLSVLGLLLFALGHLLYSHA
ncbi:hypothetical protein Cgig2_003009 [Carnegiea gigantea]|uniref:Uncharacterized protein n=1 Tax=Carnegiea gigantea TaxID=171969 RepID=A0A9Q1GMZ5_9CARY|nr:hypothetical protein Cgig2_003009 [Carnegiea gigantea]